MRIFTSLAVVFLLVTFAGGCSIHVQQAPITPYADPEVHRFSMQKIAVLPFVLPEYLKMDKGAETISIDMTNGFISEVASRRLFSVMSGGQVKNAIENAFPRTRDWLFAGTIQDAVRIGREIGADGVVFGKVRKYFDGNLSDSEVELEVTLVEVSTITTVWSIRELITGKGGIEITGPAMKPTVSARTCSLVASKNVAEKAQRIYAKGGPIAVHSTSPKKIAGYTTLAVSAVSLSVSAYYLAESEKLYEAYQRSNNSDDQVRLRVLTTESDLMWQIFGGVGLAALGTSIYLLVTDYQKVALSHPPALPEKRFVIAPTIAPNGGGVTCLFRF